MRKLRMLGFILVIALLAVSIASAQSLPVIGKLYVSKGARIPVMAQRQNGQMMVVGVTAYEDQVFYINKKVEVSGKEVYVGDATGFVRNCSEHGREVLTMPMVFVMPVDVLDADGNGLNGNPIRVELLTTK